MSRWRTAVWFVALAAPAGCFFTLGEVQQPAQPGEAGADTSVRIGEGGDAGATDALPKDWCGTYGQGALLCRDFDEPTNNEPGAWITTGGDPMDRIAAVTSDAFVSGPNAMRFRTLRIPSGSDHYEATGWFPDSDQPADTINLSFDLYIEALPTNTDVVLLYIGIANDGGSGQSLRFSLYPGGGAETSVETSDDTGGSGTRFWSNVPSIGAWTRVFVELTVGTAPKVTIGLGEPGGAAPTRSGGTLELSDKWTPGRPGFHLGLPYSGYPNVSVLLDNVLLTAK